MTTPASGFNWGAYNTSMAPTNYGPLNAWAPEGGVYGLNAATNVMGSGSLSADSYYNKATMGNLSPNQQELALQGATPAAQACAAAGFPQGSGYNAACQTCTSLGLQPGQGLYACINEMANGQTAYGTSLWGGSAQGGMSGRGFF